MRPGPLTVLGLRADFGELFGSLRRWLAYNEHRVVTLTYIGQPDEPATGPVPRLLDFAMPNATQWLTVAVLDHAGFAALDRPTTWVPTGRFPSLYVDLDPASQSGRCKTSYIRGTLLDAQRPATFASPHTWEPSLRRWRVSFKKLSTRHPFVSW